VEELTASIFMVEEQAKQATSKQNAELISQNIILIIATGITSNPI
jgi:hypothetical protein